MFEPLHGSVACYAVLDRRSKSQLRDLSLACGHAISAKPPTQRTLLSSLFMNVTIRQVVSCDLHLVICSA